MTTKFEFRDILPEELDQVIQIEQICFPPNEACSAKSMRERVANAPETFMVAVDKKFITKNCFVCCRLSQWGVNRRSSFS